MSITNHNASPGSSPLGRPGGAALSVQIIDDHRLFVAGLEKIIGESGTAKVIGFAYNAREGLEMLRFEQGDVLLLDVHLPDGNGVDLCPQIKAKYPALKILALTSFSEYAVVNRMLESGANGYVLKNAMPEEILLGIETVAAGEQFLCHEVDLLLKRQAGKAVVLSRKEREVLRFIVEGDISTEIAEKVHLSVDSINNYRKNLLLKLEARNTAALVKIALEQKLV